MIRFENTSVRFKKDGREFTAVDSVSLQIKKGEFFGIVGASGAGKSTLVRTVNLLTRPTSGSVYIDGTDVTSYQGRELSQLRLKIGMIFQHFNLIKNATVAENVAFALEASDTPKDRIAPRVLELLDVVGLASKAKSYPSDLSGGQKQRVAIARAIVNDPSFILADEPTGALDTKTSAEIMELFKSLNDDGKTVIIITHDPTVAESCKRQIEISDGKIK